MNTKIRLVVILITGLVLATVLVLNKGSNQPLPEKVALRADIEVIIKAKRFNRITTSIPLNIGGKAREKEKLRIKAQVPGVVAKTLVKRGDKVAQGQMVCLLDDKVLKAQLDSCKAREKEAQVNFKNSEKLFKAKHQSKSQLYAAQSKLALITAEITKKQNDFDNTKIKSHITGIVTDELPVAGSTVTVGEKITTIVSDKTPEIDFYVSEKDVSKIAIGNHVSIRCLGASFKGKISYIAPSADIKTRTFLCVGQLDEEAKNLKANTTVNLTVETAPQKIHILPNNCLTITSEGKTSIVILTPDNKQEESFNTATASLTNVKVLKQTKDSLYVLGLPKTPLVVILGNNFIKDKMTVKYVEVE